MNFIKEINGLTEAQMYNVLRNISTSGDQARRVLEACINHEKKIKE